MSLLPGSVFQLQRPLRTTSFFNSDPDAVRLPDVPGVRRRQEVDEDDEEEIAIALGLLSMRPGGGGNGTGKRPLYTCWNCWNAAPCPSALQDDQHVTAF